MKTIVNYAQKVKEQHALNKTLAPVETDLTDASRDYAIGEQFIHDGDLFKAKTAIAEHDALVLDTNYEAADDITTQIKNKTVTTDPAPTEGSTNPVQSNGVFVENRNIYAVNGKMGAKALLPISLADIKAKNTTGTWNNNAYAINGVTYTVNTDSDGFITDIAATGTASADATLMVYGYSYTSSYAVTYDTPVIASIDFVGSDSTARGIVWGTNSSYIEATEVQIPAGTIYGFGLRVLNGYEIPVGGITFKPMIRFASDTDATYQPYVKTNKELTAENEALAKELEDEAATRSALGAKNILPFDLAEIKALNTNGTWAGNVYTYRGVAFTVNSDGTISATGTATGGNASIKLFAASSNYEMLGKEVILTGCPSNGSASTYRIQAYRMASADGSTGTYFDDGAGTDAFTVLNDASGTVGSFAVAVYENATVTNLLFKPMVRLASDPDATYQPYAKTNQELTAENQTLTQKTDDIEDNQRFNGCFNLCPNNLTSQTFGGVQFTVNANKSISMTPTSSVIGGGINIFENSNNPIVLERSAILYFGDNTYPASLEIIATYSDDSSVVLNSSANKATLHSGNIKRVRIYFNNTFNQTMTLYPMISYYDGDYVPHAMTNRELTEVKTGTISNGADYSTYIDSATDQSLIKVGRLCIFNYNFVLKSAAADEKTVFTLSEKPTNTIRLRGASQDNNHPLDLKITTSGEVQVYQGVANTRYNGQFIFFTE